MLSLMDQVYKNQAFAGRVKRWHTAPMIKEQTVAEHSHRVLTLFIELFGLPRIEVFLYIIYHDFGELYSGDTPFRAKREQRDLKQAVNNSEQIGLSYLGVKLPELIGDEWLCFKVADMLEMYETSILEVNMGNKYACLIKKNIEEGVTILTEKKPEIQQIVIHWMTKTSQMGCV